MASHHESAEHIEEFGNVDDIVHVKPPPDGASVSASVSRVANRLRKRLFRPRKLQQYFRGTTLYRTPENRKITNDELFLDLIIVAAVAAIGHELRETFQGWYEMEKFLLLFGAVYSVWRGLALYWNLWESTQDLIDKIFVYTVFTMLTGIGIGAHGAFTTCLPWVSGASFLGNVIPWGLSAYHSQREAGLKGKDNVINNGLLVSGVQILGALPYLAACFVRSERAAKILFWIPPVFQSFATLIAMTIFRYLHRNHANRTNFAVSIELFVEKFEVLTLIVLGESLLAILFEAAKYVTKEGARINLLYGCVLCATGIVSSLAIFYLNIDGKILRGSTHAIRHNAFMGLLWSILHLPFHICLVLFATGLGIAFRDIIIKPKPADVEAVIKAVVHAAAQTAADKAATGPQFGSKERWLFTVGWGGSLVLSGALGFCHFIGERDFTKRARVSFRCILAIALSVGLPFAELSAENFVLIFALVTFVMAFTEYILVVADRVNLLRQYRKKNRDLDGDDKNFFRDSIDDDEYSSSDEEDDTVKEAEAEMEDEQAASPDADAQLERLSECRALQATRARLKQKGRNRLVVVNAESKGIDKCTDKI